MSFIEENLEIVRDKIERACRAAGRDTDEVRLIAVSKTRPIEAVLEAYRLGTVDFGENKVDEICLKQPELKSANWHMIGHLQRNKAKKVIDKICMLHSLDSILLAEQLQKHMDNMGISHLDTLIELNIGMEDSKYGISEAQLPYFVEELSRYDKIHIRGLMTVAPFVENPEDNRAIFSKMRDLAIDISGNLPHNSDMTVLSMGMSNDFEVAISEGATMVRIGTDIFGEREYKSINS